MKNEKVVKGLRTVIIIIDSIFVIICGGLQIAGVNLLAQAVIGMVILMLTTIILVFDGIYKDYKLIAIHGILYLLFSIDMIIQLFTLAFK